MSTAAAKLKPALGKTVW